MTQAATLEPAPDKSTKPAKHWSERDSLSVYDVAKILGISRLSAYDAVRRKQIPSIRIGRRVIIPRVAIQRMLEAV